MHPRSFVRRTLCALYLHKGKSIKDGTKIFVSIYIIVDGRVDQQQNEDNLLTSTAKTKLEGRVAHSCDEMR